MDAGKGHGGTPRPPLRPRTVAIAWAVMAAGLAILVLGVIRDPGPQDDPEPSRQRPGLLVDGEDARVVADLELPGDPLGRRPVLLLFDRAGPSPESVASVLPRLPDEVALVAVVPSAGRDRRPSPAVGVVVDPARRIARAVGLSAPRDGGFPTGYVLVDRQGRVRYATLDPGYADHLVEIHTLARAVR